MAAAPSTNAAGQFVGGEPLDGDSACSTPFVSAPSSPARGTFPSGCFFSAPASPTGGGVEDLDFEFSSLFHPSAAASAAAVMSSADELFHNGQIRPVRLSSLLLRPQALPLLLDLPADQPPPPPLAADERGRLRSRSVHRKSRSLSPFRTQWLSPSPSPALEYAELAATPTASRSSSSSSTASSASSSSRTSRRWGFLKDLLHRSKSDGGKQPPPPSPPPAKTKRIPSPAPARSGRGRRRSAHERLYEARRAEAAEMRRRTLLPYRQGLLLGCLGFSSRGFGAINGYAKGLDVDASTAAAVSSTS